MGPCVTDCRVAHHGVGPAHGRCFTQHCRREGTGDSTTLRAPQSNLWTLAVYLSESMLRPPSVLPSGAVVPPWCPRAKLARGAVGLALSIRIHLTNSDCFVNQRPIILSNVWSINYAMNILLNLCYEGQSIFTAVT